ncbi:MAG: FHA domain-containing protein [Gemmatimonadetes bacterium]|nr:FHA domain-containing protein [Gemmatimonadota bacterium]
MILHDERRELDLSVAPTGARLGRDPALDLAFPEEDSVVSAVHARVWREADGTWWLQDLGSTNGTWLNGRRITGAERLRSGDRFTLGQRGPALRATLPGELARTQPERGIDTSQPLLRLRRVKGGEDLTGAGSEIVIGRAATCTIPLRTVVDTVVSKRHAVVEIDENGAATLTDVGSKNGTFLNGTQIHGRAMLRVGDRIMLGWHGPLLEVRILGPAMLPEGEGAAYHPELQPAKTFVGMVQHAQSQARGATGVRTGVFVRAMARQMARESSVAFRVAVLGSMVLLLGAIAYVYRSAERQTAAAAARLATTERALTEQVRSATLAQQRAQEELTRLQRDLAAARRASVSRAVLDSLERRLREAEARAASGTAPGAAAAADFTRVAADNQPAVGLVIVRFPDDSIMGSGFVVTPSGYFITNRHVVQDAGRGSGAGSAGLRSIEIIMADTRTPLPADLVAVSTVPDQDLAILKIRGYRGEVVRSIDWQGRGIRQGAPAALIGFPGGTQLAIDRNGYVRTTMFAGIISKTTSSGSEWVQFGGTTFSGASGSPIFNADGEVIAVHFGGLREGPGLGFSVPVDRVRRWLPAEARAELGL